MIKATLLVALATLAIVCSSLAQQPPVTTTPTPTPPSPTPTPGPAPTPAPANNETCKTTPTKPTSVIEKFVFNSCIVAQFSVHLKFNQTGYLELKNGSVDTKTSSCGNSTANPATWPVLAIDYNCGKLVFNIDHNNNSQTFVKAITGEYKLNSTTQYFKNETSAFFTTQSGRYYKCNSEQSVLDKDVSLVLSNFAFEAYRTTNSTDFYQIPEECPLDSMPVSDLVRIGVGVCLIALVAIVLIAYFIGRRRWSERSSYESV